MNAPVLSPLVLFLLSAVLPLDAQDIVGGKVSKTYKTPPAPEILNAPSEGPVPHAVVFMSDAPTKNAEFEWSFGDGNRSFAPTPTHTYLEPGTYTVTLTITYGVEVITIIEPELVHVLEPLSTTVAFTRVTDEVGLVGTYTAGNSHTGGNAWVDINNDYWADLFITNGSGLEHFLFLNLGDGTFLDISQRVAKPDLAIEDAGVKFCDLENDGDQDILVIADSPTWVDVNGFNPPGGGPNVLYRNLGNGTFVDAAEQAGLVDPLGRRNSCAAIADYDRDGLLDIWVGNWTLEPTDFHGNPDRLLRNTGTGFEDVTAQTGVDGYGLDALTGGWFDVQLDGWPDLYVGNAISGNSSPGPNQDAFYINNEGKSFTEVWAGLPWIGDEAAAAMGWDVGDIDNDGDWDLYVTDMYQPGPAPFGNPLYLGEDGGLSDNVAKEAGVQSVASWPCNFADFDRDGLVDLWVGTIIETFVDFLYRNNGDGTFSPLLVPDFTNNRSRGGSICDYDGDGDVDIFFHNDLQVSALMRNDSTDTHNWLEVKLIGQVSNRDAIGAHIDLFAGSIKQMRRISGGDSAHSQMDLIAHFGLGTETVVDLTITWPSGAVRVIEDVAANQLVFIDELSGLLSEELAEGTFVHDPVTGHLTVYARSSFGGRSTLAIDGLGVLEYDALAVAHMRTFPGVLERPEDLTIRSSRGGSWTIR